MPIKPTTREQLVSRFHHAMGLDISSQPRVSLLQLRRSLISEETSEVIDALEVLELELMRGNPGTKEQWAHLLKELADLQYVLSGTVVSLYPLSGGLRTAFNRVHDSNMSMFGDDGKPVYRADGKIIKAPNYQEPDNGDVIYG